MLKPFLLPDTLEAGLDEAGRGCLAGPVVAAAVILPEGFECEELNDSKKLSAKMRERLRPLIQEAAIAWCVAEVSTQEIDEINILNASILAMHRAVDGLKVRPNHLLVDGNRFKPYPEIPHTTVVKGDATFMSIAAASILAKTYRDELMMQLAKECPGYGWERNMGYPSKEHREAIKNLGLTRHHRLTYGPCRLFADSRTD